MTSEIGDRLGKYVLQSRLGQGGMGIVFLATDTRLQREVALKLLPPELAADEEAGKRFLREARAAARLNHPNVVAIHDVDEDSGRCFLVMELVTGGNVQSLLRDHGIPWQDATRMIAETCRGLAAAHEAGLIHRDIKPSNLMLAADGSVKLADFGLAKVANDPLGQHQLTRSATIFGTPDFMSPEQCRGDTLDSRCDLYSLGATYYAMLTGRPPYTGEQAMQVMFAHCSKPTPDPRLIRADVPEGCAQIVAKAMAKNRADRFGSAREMAAALQEVLTGGPTTRLSQTLEAPPIAIPPPPPSQPLGETARAPAIATDAVAPREGKPPAEWQKWWPALAALLVVLVGWIAWPLVFPGSSDDPPRGKHPDNGGPQLTHTTAAPKLSLTAEFPKTIGDLRGVALAADGSRLFTAADDGAVKEWTLARQSLVREYQGTDRGLRAIAQQGNLVAAGGDAKVLYLWQGSGPSPKQKLNDFQGEISALAFRPDGKRLAVGTYGELRLYEVDAQGNLRLIRELGKSNSGEVNCYMVKSLAFSSDGAFLAATTWGEKGAAVWASEDGKLLGIERGRFQEPIGIAFLPEGQSLAFGSIGEGVCVWDWKKKSAQLLADSTSASTRAIAIFPGGAYAISVGEWGGNLELYDLRTGRRVDRVVHPTQAGAGGVIVSPGGTQLITWGGDDQRGNGYLHLWSIRGGAAP